MKRYILICALAVLQAPAGCSTDEINTYSGENYIQFLKGSVDSTIVTFATFPGIVKLEIPVPVEMSGLAPNAEMAYKLVVDTEFSDAVEGVHFTMPVATTFKPGTVRDTCYVTFLRTEEMRNRQFSLILRVADNENYKIGESANGYYHFNVSAQFTQPVWWNTYASNYYLGAYSDLKYEHFILATGVWDLPTGAYDLVRHYALVFKRYLEAKEAADETIYEANGNKMTVIVNN